MITLDLSILNQKGTPMFFSDLTANRPAAGIVGRIFIATDSPYGIFRDTGSAWDQIAVGTGLSGSGTATQVAFWNGTNSISGSNNLYWNSTSNFLGINTNTPGNALDVHSSASSVAAFNQTTATNNTLLALLNSGTPLWRIGNFYTSGANDFGIFDVVGALQQFTIVKTTGQTFIGTKTTASGRLVINNSTDDSHLQIIGANSPSIRIDNAGSGGTQRFVIGNATATNNFIQGSTAGQFCITPASSAAVLFGMWQSVNATEVFRISTASNLLVGTSVDSGFKLNINGTTLLGNDTRITFGSLNQINIKANVDGSTPYIDFLNSGVNTYRLNGVVSIASSGLINAGGMSITNTSSTTQSLLLANIVAQNNIEIAGTRLFMTNSTGEFGILFLHAGTSYRGLIGYDVGTTYLQIRTGNAQNFSTGTLSTIFDSTGSVGIGGITTINASARLQIDSTTKGFLPPRMTTTQKNAITTPAAGLVIYDTTLNKLCVYTTAWQTITSV